MKTIKFYLISALMLTLQVISVYGNDTLKKVTIETDTVYYWMGDTPTMEVFYKIKNTSQQPVWIWINQENLSQMTDSCQIRKYFFQKQTPESSRFYQIAMDGNVGSFTPVVFFTFAKVIPSEGVFTIQMIFENYLPAKAENSDDWLQTIKEEEKTKKQIATQIISILNTHISIVTEELIAKVVPGMEYITVKNQFCYKPSSIALNWQLFYSQLNNALK